MMRFALRGTSAAQHQSVATGAATSIVLQYFLQQRNFSSSNFSSISGAVTLSASSNSGDISTITLSSRPVNALTRSVITDITNAINTIEAQYTENPQKKSLGLIITSDIPNIFSGGLDLNEMHRPQSRGRICSYLRMINNLYTILNKSPLCTVAALTGHSPAGGCLIALSCDYRVMCANDQNTKKPFRIGLNETALGLCAPDWAMEMMSFTSGRRRADAWLQLGSMVPAEEAYACGLVDELAEDFSSANAKAHAAAQKYMAVASPSARIRTKKLMRAPIVKLLEEFDEDFLLDQLMSEEVQQALDEYVEGMKKKK